MTADLTGGGWVGVSAPDTGGGGCVDHGLLEYLGDPAGSGKNGVVINGVISWIEIVQEGVPDGIWKSLADSHYLYLLVGRILALLQTDREITKRRKRLMIFMMVLESLKMSQSYLLY